LEKGFVFFAGTTDAVLIRIETLNNDIAFGVVLDCFIQEMEIFFCGSIIRDIESDIGI